MSRRWYGALAAVAAIALAMFVAQVFSTHATIRPQHFGKFAAGDPDSAVASPGEGPAGGFDAYLDAERAYPADSISPALPAEAAATFEQIAGKDKNGDPKGKGHKWQFLGPKQDATQPGITAFSGATNATASRVTAILMSPDCDAKHCKMWAGVAGGGVWRSDNAVAKDPDWKQLKPDQLDQNSVGALTLDPTDTKGNATIYLGTGEANRCSSGCEAGVGIYKSTNGGDKWTKLASACVSTALHPCASPGKDAFLGRGINSIVIDPRNGNHILVGSAQAVRGLSHVIGNGGTTRLEPGANEPGLYESWDGGATFTEVWDGTKPDTINGAPGSFGKIGRASCRERV